MTDLVDRDYFQPKRDEPQWRPVYDAFAARQVGDVLTYEQLTELIGADSRINRGPIYAAQRHLENNNQRTIEVVKNIGYRIVAAIEHERLANKHRKKSRVQIRKARSRIRSANRSELPPEARARFEAQDNRLAALEQMHRAHDTRIKRLEEIDREERVKQSKIDEQDTRIARLEEALKRIRQPGDQE